MIYLLVFDSCLSAMYADASVAANFSNPTEVAIVALLATNSFYGARF
jgi:hypothetical protein